MTKPRLLDLFCGAGGAGSGYHQAGFQVYGVDNRPQPRYPFPFVQADALEYVRRHGHAYDVIHASPPCQAYSRATSWRGKRSNHPDMIDQVREALKKTGMKYVIENVEDARHRLDFPIMLCGSMLGLKIRRHRYFECSWIPFGLAQPCRHSDDDYSHDHGKKQTESQYRQAMDCDWMTCHEARQAIPPAYTAWIGRRIMEADK